MDDARMQFVLPGGYQMTDVTTGQPIHVSTDGTAGPYIMVPVLQLKQVQRVLDDHELRYAVDDDAISIDGRPEIVVIDLGRRSDAGKIQAILDANP